MKVIIFVAVIFLGQSVFGQANSKKYHFDKIGMTIYVSNEFKTELPDPHKVYLGVGSKPITDSNELKMLIANEPINLLKVKSVQGFDEMSLQLTLMSDYLLQVIKLYDSSSVDSTRYLSFLKKMIIAGARQTNDKFDTLFSKVTIDGIVFDKLFSVSKIRGRNAYEGGYSAKFGQYYLFAKLFFTSKTNGDKMMHIIESAKFH